MIESNFIKPVTFIKELPGIEKVRPEFVEALDRHFFEWVEMHLPFYEEMKRREADVFECTNIGKMGEDGAERYEQGGHHYWFNYTPLYKRTLALDGFNHYEELNWRSTFWLKHPEFHGSIWENMTDNWFFSCYMTKYYKKEDRFRIIQNRMKDYFRYLTNDPDILFSAGGNTFIGYDERLLPHNDW